MKVDGGVLDLDGWRCDNDDSLRLFFEVGERWEGGDGMGTEGVLKKVLGRRRRGLFAVTAALLVCCVL